MRTEPQAGSIAVHSVIIGRSHNFATRVLSAGTVSGTGQSRQFDAPPATSGLPQSTDIARPARLVRFVPKGDVRAKRRDQRKAGLSESASPYSSNHTFFSGGIFHDPSMIEGSRSSGQYIRNKDKVAGGSREPIRFLKGLDARPAFSWCLLNR